VEVAELHDVNCGRYKAPLFLKRSKLPKVGLSSPFPPDAAFL